MNILVIIILAMFGFCVFSGYQKGFLKTAFSLVSWILVLYVCDYATPIVTQLLIEKTDIEIAVQTVVDAEINQIITEAFESSAVADLEAALPAEIKTAILGEAGSLQEVITSGMALDTSSLVNGIIEIIGFVITVIVLRIVMMMIELALGIIAKLPLIGPMDKILGIACGAGKGIIWCWIILAVVSVLALTGINTEYMAYISQSELLTWLQNNNLLLNLVVQMQ